MITIYKKISLGLATATTVTMLMTGSVFASTDVTITGNGWQSNNSVKVENNCKASVSQINEINATTSINSYADSGHVDANGNTGGIVEVTTGDAASMVKVGVTGGNNTATAPTCCDCTTTDPVVMVVENGSESTNKVKLESNNSTHTKQTSKTNAVTGVDSKAKTGKVKTNWNTGNGASVVTGGSLSKVKVTVGGGNNIVNP